MKKIDIDKRTLGVNFDADGEATIKVWSPEAKSVRLVLPTIQQAVDLAKQDSGYWSAQTNLVKPGDPYQIALDRNVALPDVVSLSQPEGVHGASVAIDLKSFEWADSEWKNLVLSDYLIYELHTGTFTAEGTFKAIEAKLDYLKDLGITAIEIMPVAQFPGERNWGYDGVFPYAVQSSYGGAEGLTQLVNACHQKGLAVVLDVVYNHLGPEGNYFTQYGPYFTEKYNTPWGNAINFDDAFCDEVRRYYIENVLMWFRDFHIDALRMDAVHAIKDFSPVHILREIKEYVNELQEATGRKHHLIVELDLNDPRFIDSLAQKGFGMDTQWVDEFHHALRVTAGGERTGYYSDFTGITQLAKSYTDAYVFDGIYSEHRKRTFGMKAEDNPGQQFVVFSQNHDQVGNRMLGERSSQLFSFEMQKLMAGAIMISPFIPLLFMGEEWSAPSPFLYFVSHGDPKLVEAVRKGRKEEFSAFHAEGEAPDPQAEKTFKDSKIPWGLLADNQSQAMLNYYKALIALRKALPALNHLDRKQIKVIVDDAKQTLTLQRWFAEQEVCCVLNFSAQQQTITLIEHKPWKKVFDSADSQWNGPGSINGTSHNITIQPQSIIIYSN